MLEGFLRSARAWGAGLVLMSAGGCGSPAQTALFDSVSVGAASGGQTATTGGQVAGGSSGDVASGGTVGGGESTAGESTAGDVSVGGQSGGGATTAGSG